MSTANYNRKPTNMGLGPAYTDDTVNPFGGRCALANSMNKNIRNYPYYGGQVKNPCMSGLYMAHDEFMMPGMNWCGIRKNRVYPEFQYGFLDPTYSSSPHIPANEVLPGANNYMKRFLYNNAI